MKNYEQIIRSVVAFASEKHWTEFEEFVKRDPHVERVYAEFIVNRHIKFIDAIDMINKHQADLPKDFKKEFVEFHKGFKDKSKKLEQKNQQVVAKIDKMTVINTYKAVTQEKTFETFKEVIKLIQQAVDMMKAKGFDSVLYGDIILRPSTRSRAVAQYFPTQDMITIELYKTYSGHALESVIHELAHRIWYKLMESKDREMWIQEYIAKYNGMYKGKNPGFPSDYSKTNDKEYFATVIENYIVHNKKYSELIDLIV